MSHEDHRLRSNHPVFQGLEQKMDRRQFLSKTSLGLGALALGSLISPEAKAMSDPSGLGLPGLPHFAPKAKRVVYLFQSGGPSQF
ncbi:MAG: twin-arginine translocation signal domain-containing protein, partial [Bacteroidota bacterium]